MLCHKLFVPKWKFSVVGVCLCFGVEHNLFHFCCKSFPRKRKKHLLVLIDPALKSAWDLLVGQKHFNNACDYRAKRTNLGAVFCQIWELFFCMIFCCCCLFVLINKSSFLEENKHNQPTKQANKKLLDQHSPLLQTNFIFFLMDLQLYSMNLYNWVS